VGLHHLIVEDELHEIFDLLREGGVFLGEILVDLLQLLLLDLLVLLIAHFYDTVASMVDLALRLCVVLSDGFFSR
jgi:hypothetical protein